MKFWGRGALITALGKKFGTTPGFKCVFFFVSQNKWNVNQNRINFSNIFVILTKKQVFCILKKLKKKQTLWPLFIDGVQLPQGYSHFEEAVYFLPFSSQRDAEMQT